MFKILAKRQKHNYHQNLDFTTVKDEEDLQALFESGVGVNDYDVKGRTLLFTLEDPKLVNIVIERGGDVNQINLIHRYSPLHNINVDKEKIKMLIQAGAKVNVKDDEKGLTPLHLCYRSENAKLLLENGANPFILNFKGENCLEIPHHFIKQYIIRTKLEEPKITIEDIENYREHTISITLDHIKNKKRYIGKSLVNDERKAKTLNELDTLVKAHHFLFNINTLENAKKAFDIDKKIIIDKVEKRKNYSCIFTKRRKFILFNVDNFEIFKYLLDRDEYKSIRGEKYLIHQMIESLMYRPNGNFHYYENKVR